MKVTDYFESNYRIRKLRGGSKNTLRLYRSSIKKLAKTLGRDPTLADLSDDNVGLMMQRVLDDGGAAATANKHRAQLLAIWRYASSQRVVDKWPTVTAEREPERVPTAWMAEDISTLLTALDLLEGNLKGTDIPRKLWWRSIVGIALDSGERIGALTQCRWDWLDRNWLLVRAEARKFGRRDRRYMLSDETVDLLAKLRPYTASSELIFPWPYTPNYLWRLYERILVEAGLPYGPRDKFHKLRRTLASVGHSMGLDAQELLDHQHRRTTKRYLDPRFTREVQGSQVLAKYLADPTLCHRDREAKAACKNPKRGLDVV
mgnify:CR=1 FL=1